MLGFSPGPACSSPAGVGKLKPNAIRLLRAWQLRPKDFFVMRGRRLEIGNMQDQVIRADGLEQRLFLRYPRAGNDGARQATGNSEKLKPQPIRIGSHSQSAAAEDRPTSSMALRASPRP